jgi:hypothetical protein
LNNSINTATVTRRTIKFLTHRKSHSFTFFPFTILSRLSQCPSYFVFCVLYALLPLLIIYKSR